MDTRNVLYEGVKNVMTFYPKRLLVGLCGLMLSFFSATGMVQACSPVDYKFMVTAMDAFPSYVTAISQVTAEELSVCHRDPERDAEIRTISDILSRHPQFFPVLGTCGTKVAIIHTANQRLSEEQVVRIVYLFAQLANNPYAGLIIPANGQLLRTAITPNR